MASTDPGDGMCHETSGFLFNHQCDRFSIGKCLKCEKPLCEDHAHETPEGTVCTTCLKRQAQIARQQDPNRSSGTGYYYHDHYYYDDPYFYGPRYYPGYGSVHVTHHTSHSDSSSAPSSPDIQGETSGGDFNTDDSDHDPSDFTEGDSESLQREGDGDFETDMGAS